MNLESHGDQSVNYLSFVILVSNVAMLKTGKNIYLGFGWI